MSIKPGISDGALPAEIGREALNQGHPIMNAAVANEKGHRRHHYAPGAGAPAGGAPCPPPCCCIIKDWYQRAM